MSKLLKIIAAWDGSEITIKPASGTVKQFMEGKCWNVACRNPFLYVHTTKNGTATHAYCNPCFRLTQYAKVYNEEKERGNWFFLEKGKIVKQKLLSELKISRSTKKSGGVK